MSSNQWAQLFGAVLVKRGAHDELDQIRKELAQQRLAVTLEGEGDDCKLVVDSSADDGGAFQRSVMWAFAVPTSGQSKEARDVAANLKARGFQLDK